jgi:hypothetical protein
VSLQTITLQHCFRHLSAHGSDLQEYMEYA